MNPYKEIYHYVIKYFSTTDEEEKAYWIEKTIDILYDIEDDEFIQDCLLDPNEETFMENIRQYAYVKNNIKKIWFD